MSWKKVVLWAAVKNATGTMIKNNGKKITESRQSFNFIIQRKMTRISKFLSKSRDELTVLLFFSSSFVKIRITTTCYKIVEAYIMVLDYYVLEYPSQVLVGPGGIAREGWFSCISWQVCEEERKRTFRGFKNNLINARAWGGGGQRARPVNTYMRKLLIYIYFQYI